MPLIIPESYADPLWKHITRADANCLAEAHKVAMVPSFEDGWARVEAKLAADRRAKACGAFEGRLPRAYNQLIRREDGEVWLVQFTATNWKKVHNFGNPLAAPEVFQAKTLPRIYVEVQIVHGIATAKITKGEKRTPVTELQNESEALLSRAAVAYVRKNFPKHVMMMATLPEIKRERAPSYYPPLVRSIRGY